jgi:hypothetical protein
MEEGVKIFYDGKEIANVVNYELHAKDIEYKSDGWGEYFLKKTTFTIPGGTRDLDIEYIDLIIYLAVKRVIRFIEKIQRRKH